MEIYTEVVSSATREALRKLGDQLAPEAVAALCCCTSSQKASSCRNRASDLEPPNGIEPLTFSLPLGADQPSDEELYRKARSDAPLQLSWEQFGTVRERCDLPNSSQRQSRRSNV